MRTLLILLAALLAGSVVALAPPASADTCASAIAEEIVCPPVLATSCTLYALLENHPVVACVLRVVPDPIVLP